MIKVAILIIAFVTVVVLTVPLQQKMERQCFSTGAVERLFLGCR